MQITTAARDPAGRRALIVQASLAVLSRHGVDGLTFARVCEEAGLSSSRLITYHFTDRAGLMAAVTERVLADMGAAVGAAMSCTRPGLGQLRDLVVANADFFRTHRGHVVALAGLAMSGSAAAAEVTSRATEAVVADLVRAGRAAGEIREDVDPADAAFLIMRTLEGLALAVVADPELAPVPRARGMADIICAGLAR